jgi:hypothetical protein
MQNVNEDMHCPLPENWQNDVYCWNYAANNPRNADIWIESIVNSLQ